MGDEDKGVFNSLFGKLDHPVLGAFASSWLLVNWDILYLLIFGRGDFHATINEIWTNYLTWSNHRIFLKPAGFTLLYLLFGPFIGDFFKLIPAWSAMWVGKLKPVPQFQLDNLKASHSQMEDERNSFREAFGMTENANNSQQNFQSLSSQNSNYRRQLEAMRHELAKLKADYLLSKTGELEIILREQNEQMKLRENTLRHLASKFKELGSTELPSALEAIKVNAAMRDDMSFAGAKGNIELLIEKLSQVATITRESFAKADQILTEEKTA